MKKPYAIMWLPCFKGKPIHKVAFSNIDAWRDCYTHSHLFRCDKAALKRKGYHVEKYYVVHHLAWEFMVKNALKTPE